MDRQAIARGDSAVLAFQVRIDGDYHERADEFAAALEFTGGSEHPKIRLCSGDFCAGIADSRGGAAKVAALWAPAHLDSLQHLGLKGRAEALGGFKAAAAGHFFQFLERGNAEVAIAFLTRSGRRPGRRNISSTPGGVSLRIYLSNVVMSDRAGTGVSRVI